MQGSQNLHLLCISLGKPHLSLQGYVVYFLYRGMLQKHTGGMRSESMLVLLISLKLETKISIVAGGHGMESAPLAFWHL